MLIELLQLPERQNSITPELVEFFRREAGSDWEKILDSFIRSFSGTQFTVPGPETIAEIKAEGVVVKSLRRDDSVENRIRLMQDYGIAYSRMQRAYQAVEGKTLSVPATEKGRIELLKEVARLLRLYPKLENDLIAMFAISARDRSIAVATAADMRRRQTDEPPEELVVPSESNVVKTAKTTKKSPARSKPRAESRKASPSKVRKKVAKKKQPAAKPKAAAADGVKLSDVQLLVLQHLKANGATHPDNISTGTIRPTRAVNALQDRGYIRRNGKTGQAVLTASGRKAIAAVGG